MSDLKCKTCGKVDGFFFSLNDGIYCESDWKVALVLQKMRLKIDEMRGRMGIEPTESVAQ